MRSLGITSSGGIVSRIAPAPTVSVSNFNAYTNNLTITPPAGISPSTYIIEVSTSASGPWTEVYRNTASTFQHTGISPSSTRHYRARYINSINLTTYPSSSVSVTTRAATIKRQTFNSSTTWTKPIGVTSVGYLVVAGGGNGGASLLSAPTNLVNTRIYAGGGGGAGDVVPGTYAASVEQETITITVGAAGQNSVAFGQTALAGGNGGCLIPGQVVTPGRAAGGAGFAIVEPDFGNRSASYQGGGAAGNRSKNGGNGWCISYVGGVSITSDGISGTSNNYRASGGGGGGNQGVGNTDSNGTGTPAYGYNTSAPPGGSGVTSSISGSSVTYGVGGNGGLTALSGQVPTGANGIAGATPGSGGSGGRANNNLSNTTRTGGAGAAGTVLISWSD